MPKKPKVPVRVQRVIEKCKSGRSVCMTVNGPDERAYWLEPGGQPVGEWTFKRALELGLLEPVGDSLFPGMESQTYRASQ